jgi:hypothetical protein
MIGNVPIGLAHVSIALLPLAGPSGTIAPQQDRLPLHIVNVSDTIVPNTGNNCAASG